MRRFGMSVLEIILIAVLAIAVVAAVIGIIRIKKKGGCSCGCENCPYPCSQRKQ